MDPVRVVAGVPDIEGVGVVVGLMERVEVEVEEGVDPVDRDELGVLDGDCVFVLVTVDVTVSVPVPVRLAVLVALVVWEGVTVIGAVGSDVWEEVWEVVVV